MKRVLSISAILTVIGALAVTGAPAASAAGTTGHFSGGILTLTGTLHADATALFCNGGFLDGSGLSMSGSPIACTAITQIKVNSLDGNDEMSLNSVVPATFPNITLTTINGGKGNDQIYGTDLADTVNGGTGNDDIHTGRGTDSANGGGGIDRSVEEAGVATDFDLTNTALVMNATGNDTLSSIEQASIVSGNGDDTVDTTAFSGDVLVDTGGGGATIDTGSGDDQVIEAAGAAIVNTGSGDDNVQLDTFSSDGFAEDVQGGPGQDVIDFQGSDLVMGPATITSSNAGTIAHGGFEDAFVRFTAGSSTAATWPGTVTWQIVGDSGVITGSQQDDVFDLYDNAEGYMDGGGGADLVLMTVPNGTTSVEASPSSVTQHNGSGDFSIDQVDMEGLAVIGLQVDGVDVDAADFEGGLSTDLSKGANTVIGTGQKDSIWTGKANDTITGGPGNDYMNGGKQTDTCNGGPGNDTAVKCEKGQA